MQLGIPACKKKHKKGFSVKKLVFNLSARLNSTSGSPKFKQLLGDEFGGRKLRCTAGTGEASHPLETWADSGWHREWHFC
jgi:hypothetical protein